MTREEIIQKEENIKDLKIKVEELELFFKLIELEAAYTRLQENQKNIESKQNEDGTTKGKDNSNNKKS